MSYMDPGSKLVVYLPKTPLLVQKNTIQAVSPSKSLASKQNFLGFSIKSKSIDSNLKFISHRYKSAQKSSQNDKISLKTKRFLKPNRSNPLENLVDVSNSIIKNTKKRDILRRPLHMNFRSFFFVDNQSKLTQSSFNQVGSSISSNLPKPNRLPSKQYISSMTKSLFP